CSDFEAAALDEQGVAPEAVHLGDAFAATDFAEAAAQMERETGAVLREDGRLQRPDACRFRRLNQGAHERRADTRATKGRTDIDAVLGDAGIDAAAGHWRQRGPALNRAVVGADDQATVGPMGAVPNVPIGCLRLEGGIAGGDALGVNGSAGG